MIKYIHYKVNWGDTLENISLRYNLLVDDLKYINKLDNIFVGQILLIPVRLQSITPKEMNISLNYCFKRHLNKRKLFNFYAYKKSHH